MSTIDNWTLAPGTTWYVVRSSYGPGHKLAHVGAACRTLCGRRLQVQELIRIPHGNVAVCGNCERVLAANEADAP